MVELLEKLSNKELTVSNGKINQTERNELKNDLTDSLVDVLNNIENAELNAVRTIDGVAVEIVVGKHVLYAVLDPVIKPLDYDIDIAIDEYNDKVAAKIERDKKALEKKSKSKK